MTKYAANAMLATRISFMNEIANLCERVGANVDQVRRASAATRASVGVSVSRPGLRRLLLSEGREGAGDSREDDGTPLRILEAVEAVNDEQKHRLFEELAALAALGGKLGGPRIAVWGLAFKPQTDDMRERRR